MRRVLAPFLLLATTAGLLHARLGEDRTQTLARYGPAVSAAPGEGDPNGETLCFAKNGFRILAVFPGLTCELLLYHHPGYESLSDTEMNDILTANADGQAWTPSSLISRDPIWNRGDGAVARYDTIRQVMAICSPRYIAAEKAREKDAKARAIDQL